MVYPVYGGMEDWVYASGWDPAGLQLTCRGLARGEKMATSQAAVFLVETSDSKSPPGPELGCESGVLSNANTAVPVLPPLSHPTGAAAETPVTAVKHEPVCNGHVQRNIRLSLSAVDLVQPYVCLSKLSLVHSMDSKDNVDTGTNSRTASSHTRSVPSIQVSWYVGGGHHVNATWLSLHTSPLQRSQSRGLSLPREQPELLSFRLVSWLVISLN